MNIIDFLQDGWKDMLGNKKDFISEKEKEEMMDLIADQEYRWGEEKEIPEDVQIAIENEEPY